MRYTTMVRLGRFAGAIVDHKAFISYILWPSHISMSVTGKCGVGIPIILLHDAEGAIVTVELKNGEMYRGYLDEAEDNMNCVLKVFNLILFLTYNHIRTMLVTAYLILPLSLFSSFYLSLSLYISLPFSAFNRMLQGQQLMASKLE
jgi:hypothetical protein